MRPKGQPKIGGRVKGTPNKATTDIRARFNLLVQNNLEQLEADLKLLKPVDRIKALTDLAKFCIPTLKSVDFKDDSIPKKETLRIVFEKK